MLQKFEHSTCRNIWWSLTFDHFIIPPPWLLVTLIEVSNFELCFVVSTSTVDQELPDEPLFKDNLDFIPQVPKWVTGPDAINPLVFPVGRFRSLTCWRSSTEKNPSRRLQRVVSLVRSEGTICEFAQILWCRFMNLGLRSDF